MNKLVKMLVVAGVFAGLALSATAVRADAVSDQRKAQNKLLAQRAARADAIRKLAERIKGLHLTSETTVNDFVTENDTIRTALNASLAGMREKDVKYMEDGTCEVKMEITLETVITTLKEIHNRYAKGDKFKAEDFMEMTQTNEIKVLTETGNGAPRPEWEEGNGATQIPRGETAESR